MFSEKNGYKKKCEIQYERVSNELRNRIWNLFYQNEIKAGGISSKHIRSAWTGGQTIEEQIVDRFGLLISRQGDKCTPEKQLMDNVLKFFAWYEVYDFVEIHLSCLTGEEKKERVEQYNKLFEQEKAGYRIVCEEVTPITNEHEIITIEQAADTDFKTVNQHIRKALSLYADLKEPDYENTVKEAISAVEAMCCIITGATGAGASLGKSLKKLEDKGVHIHPSLRSAFLSLYGYASDENGIRHGGVDFKNVPEEDAKYMLVSCSAFVNYLVEKYRKIETT